MIRASLNIVIPNKSMHLTTKSGRCHLQSYGLQDYHKVGSKTRLPPAGTRPHYETSSNIQYPLGKLQTSETGIWSKILTKRFWSSDVQNLWGRSPLPEPERWHTLWSREDAEHRHLLKIVTHWGEIMGSRQTKRYASLGEQIKVFENDLKKDRMKPCITRQSESNQRVQSTGEQVGCLHFAWNGRLPRKETKY